MQPRSSVKVIGVSVALVGVASAAILTVAMRGSIFASNFVCNTDRNPNCGLISGIRALIIPEYSNYTGSGGNVKVGSGPTATAKYEALRHINAFSGSIATSRGLRAGSSATLFVVLDIVRNDTGVSYDCILEHANASGTGSAKITLFDNKSATGTYIYATPFVKGAYDVGSCATLGTPKANSDIRLTFITTDAAVGK